MRNMLILKDGIVVAREVGVSTNAERAALALAASAEADRLEADKASAQAAVVIPSVRISPELQPAFRRDAVERKIAELRDSAALLSVTDTRVQVDAAIYSESVGNAPLVWPRSYRDALLTATDYVEVAGWRSSKSAAISAEADAYRAALRGLPAAHPDPIAIVWPIKPVGV